MLEIGTIVADFSLYDAFGKLHTLSDYRGKKVVIYFYPKDDTPGCTTQACAFRDAYDDFKRHDIVVIGISKDSPKSHQKFIEKFGLPFILLSDEDVRIATYFGVYIEKSMYGKKYMGVNRSTFVLDEKGMITQVFEKASPSENADDILKFIK
ncbi:MAG: thioredoxin-dependent thiol peroxidase [Firmicutes bacterium]|nr:thioredoxin-dependent thiol peroxidase [Bacillota bacterium]